MRFALAFNGESTPQSLPLAFDLGQSGFAFINAGATMRVTSSFDAAVEFGFNNGDGLSTGERAFIDPASTLRYE